ncbi:hypothetical protein L873DRAFT_1809146 [Choiromyces venosus 120613-1]|uniref:H-type lectin domain-containing protein n=1 Tax=Choiromyces venosus 120613-1 TaxID=1336337 RepID=A0A3N4JLU7_9PEZI|nr:hypothetical protein L873DRAFT_1809146 [Choiromyces venosus 120613-1]
MASSSSSETARASWTPPPSEDQNSQPPILQIGHFSSREVRSTTYKTAEVTRRIHFSSPYSRNPGLVIAITHFDLDYAWPHLAVSVSDKCASSFTGTILSKKPFYSGACSWLAIPPEDEDFLCGTVRENWENWLSDGTAWTEVIRPVQFERNFSSPPKVVVWLSEVELEKGVRVSAAGIHTYGFSVRFEIKGLVAPVNDAVVSWVAYPADRPGIYSGTTSTEAQRPTTWPQLYNTGYVGFPEGVFKKTPRVMAGVNYLDIDTSKTNPRLGVTCSNVNIFGMTWDANSWFNSVINGVGISYLVLE